MKLVSSSTAATGLALALFGATVVAQAPAQPQSPPPAPAVNTPAPTPEPAKKAETTKPATKKKSTATKAVPAKKKTETAATTTGPAVAATVKSDRVNIRGQAALVGEVITQLRKGEAVSILEEISVKSPATGEPAVWAKIAMPGNVPVWVNSEFLDGTTKTVKSARLNVRAGPGENFSIIGRLAKGDTVKEIRQVDAWTEIETPPGVFGFVALDLLQKGDGPASVAAAPKAEPGTPTTPEPAKPEPKKPEVAKVEPTPEPARPQDPAVTPLVLPGNPAPAPEAQPVKRIVRREGVVRPTASIQAPTPYCIEDVFDKRLINYLSTDLEGVQFRKLKGAHIIVTGTEDIDPRWPRTPILKVETLEVTP